MAGTRLLIQSSFLVQLLVVWFVALYYGLVLTSDPLSHHLPFRQSGRDLLQQSVHLLKEAETNPIAIPLTKVAIAKGSEHLQSLLVDTNVVLIVESDENLDKVCSISSDGINEKELPQELYSIWLCPQEFTSDNNHSASKGFQQGTVLTRAGITRIYPSSHVSLESIVKSMFQTTTSRDDQYQRWSLKVSLVVDAGRMDWREWGQSFQYWMERSGALEWPCLQHHSNTPSVPIEIVTANLIETAKASMFKDPISNQTIYRLSSQQLHQALKLDDENKCKQRDILHIILVVPEKPLLIVDQRQLEASTFFSGKTDFVSLTTTIGEPETEEDYKDVVENALFPLNDFLVRQCMSAPTTGMDQLFWRHPLLDDSSFPNWYLEWWLQNSLQVHYTKSIESLMKEATLLLDSPTSIAIDEEVGQEFLQLVQGLFHAMEDAKDHYFMTALTGLEDLLKDLHNMRIDPKFSEPLDFSPAQLMAILAPLLAPLLLPSLVGIVREVKRYKQLRAKSNAVECVSSKQT